MANITGKVYKKIKGVAVIKSATPRLDSIEKVVTLSVANGASGLYPNCQIKKDGGRGKDKFPPSPPHLNQRDEVCSSKADWC
jgi:hypothetical protein